MRRRERGFTLVEILISLSLASLLVAGAFQIHSVFNGQSMRQKQISDMQQSLRISMQTIERAIRGSGAGMSNGKMVTTGCAAGTPPFYRVQMYNNMASTAWPPPKLPGSFDSTTGDLTTNPDVLRVIAAVDNIPTTVSPAGDSATQVTVVTPINAFSAGTFQLNDFLLFMNTTTATATTSYGLLRQITTAPTSSTLVPGTTNYQTVIAHASNATYPTCVNADTATSLPLQPVHHFRNQLYFRILNPGGMLDQAKLVVAIAPIGDAPATPTWSIIADDIEDMQLALMMLDGRVCNDVDDPALCDPSQAAALRVTLTARQFTPNNAVPGKYLSSYMGGYEDESQTLATDNRVRRSLTSEITLRN